MNAKITNASAEGRCCLSCNTGPQNNTFTSEEVYGTYSLTMSES